MNQQNEPILENSPKVPLRALLGDFMQGRSLTRAWMDHRLKSVTVRGRVLDFGGGGSKYSEKVKAEPGTHFVTLDIRSGPKPTVVGDGEKSLPFKTGTFDAVLFLNVLEHLFDYETALKEIARVLKPGGVLYSYSPFMYPRHTSRHEDYFVDDHFRFGGTALKRYLRGAGFTGPLAFEVCGEGPFTAAANIVAIEMPFGFLRVICHVTATLADRLLASLRHGPPPAAQRAWPIAYWVAATR